MYVSREEALKRHKLAHKILLDYLQKMRQHRSRLHFNLAEWFVPHYNFRLELDEEQRDEIPHECGAVACAVGILCYSDRFPYLHLRGSHPSDGQYTGWCAVDNCFGVMDDANPDGKVRDLFLKCHYDSSEPTSGPEGLSLLLGKMRARIEELEDDHG